METLILLVVITYINKIGLQGQREELNLSQQTAFRTEGIQTSLLDSRAFITQVQLYDSVSLLCGERTRARSEANLVLTRKSDKMGALHEAYSCIWITIASIRPTQKQLIATRPTPNCHEAYAQALWQLDVGLMPIGVQALWQLGVGLMTVGCSGCRPYGNWEQAQQQLVVHRLCLLGVGLLAVGNSQGVDRTSNNIFFKTPFLML